jgi:(E)-4-hydroxy-3-methylbut-2-enyl-diphosphate synthase
MTGNTTYCNSLVKYSRLRTIEVKVGKLGFGADNPIRLQSMTTTDTMDTVKSVEQAIRMIHAGCELVRYAAPSKNEAENLKLIHEQLHEQGYHTPLVADIHFTPNAAEIAALYVEKVRVNPGNYADKKKFVTHNYTDASYQAELDRIREKFTPLVLLCKENGRAMRIGTNHGSLSDRIMSRYGDTPWGMVQSAMEFVQICEDNDYYSLIISMKSSNPVVMVQAYRMLVAEMMNRGRVYPLHLGVTEAGEGEDGRIKSAVGIGALLEDGIGDTIRVSLTEEPEFEIPVARMLADRYENREFHFNIDELDGKLPYNPFEYNRRKSKEILNIGGRQVPVVLSDLSQIDELKPAHLFGVGYIYKVDDDKWDLKEQAVDYLYCGRNIPSFELPGTLGVICDSEIWEERNQVYPLFEFEDFLLADKVSDQLNFVRISAEELEDIDRIEAQLRSTQVVILLNSTNNHAVAEMRRYVIDLMQRGIDCPVIIDRSYEKETDEQFQISSSVDCGSLLLDGMGDGIFISSDNPLQLVVSTAFGILQATRTRISKTEYISCPSCGRTLFDLQETTAKIRAKTDHLKGLKIGIMGCIVNGPGEMADADYGYVGVGKGKINLYKEKEVVKRNISEEDALDELIALIQDYGDWIDP